MPRASELSRSHRQQDRIREALLAGELRARFQRIVDLTDGRVQRVEALLRWEHPEGGLLPPEDFLPAVAHHPIADDITRWMLHSALQALRAWPGCTVSLNVTARDVSRRGFVADVVRALTQSGIPPWRLTLELTEPVMGPDFGEAVNVLELLRELGVGLALDDFGTGYSPLLYLRDLPITEVKIDRTFVAGLPAESDSLAIVRSVAKLARSIGIQVVAVGVETAVQACIAREAGCHAGQGFLWGEPSCARDIEPDQAMPVPNWVIPHEQGWPVRDLTCNRRILELVEEGASLRTVAAALNTEGLRTAENARWTPAAVARVLSDVPAPCTSSDSPPLTWVGDGGSVLG